MAEAQWHDCRKVGPDYAYTAPARYVVERDIAAPRQTVWDVFTDAATTGDGLLTALQI